MSVITITKENFAAEVLNSDKPVLLDFWASWCGPCRMLSPIVDQVADERPDVKVGKVNVDEQPDLAGQFGVMSIPTLLVFKNGKLVNQSVGSRPKAGVLALLHSDTKLQTTSPRQQPPPPHTITPPAGAKILAGGVFFVWERRMLCKGHRFKIKRAAGLGML